MSKTRREVNSYYHGPVDIGHGNTADYVVAHGERQIQRGKNPSVAFWGREDSRIAEDTTVEALYAPRTLLFGRAAFEAAQEDLRQRHEDDGEEHEADVFLGRVVILHVDNETRIPEGQEYAEIFIENDGVVGGIITTAPEPDYNTLPDDGTVRGYVNVSPAATILRDPAPTPTAV